MGRFKGYKSRYTRIQAMVATGLMFVVMSALALGQQIPGLPGQTPPPTTPGQAPPPTTPAQVAPQPAPASTDPKFTAAEITSPKIAIGKLKGDNSLLTNYLRGKVPATSQIILINYDGTSEPSPAIIQVLLDALNATIDDDTFYNSTRIDVAKMPKDIQDGIKANVQGADRKLLNRRLLEESYPDFLAKIASRQAAPVTTPIVQPAPLVPAPAVGQPVLQPKVPNNIGPDFLETESSLKQSPLFGFDIFASSRARIDKMSKEAPAPSATDTGKNSIGNPIVPGNQNNPIGVVSDKYQLGPGDVMNLRYWSKTMEALETTLQLNEQGSVTLPTGDKLVARGQTLLQFEQNLRRVMRLKFRNVEILLTMRELRTVAITVQGESYSPGPYYVPSVYTLYGLLLLSGGPTEAGSLRDIQLKRGGTVHHFDLYRYLMSNDKSQDIGIQAGDVLYIPLSGPRVHVGGEVRRSYTFELLKGQTLKEVFVYAGGIKPTGAKVQIETIDTNLFRKIVNFDLLNLAKSDGLVLKDGDSVRVTSVRSRIQNQVTIEGAVDQPGKYPIAPNMRVKDLVEMARKFTEEAYIERADLYRLNPDNTFTLYQITLSKAMKGDPEANILLQEQDRLRVYSIEDVQWTGYRSIEVVGAVRRPRKYYRSDNMRVRDMILLAGGLNDNAYAQGAQLQRQNPDDTYGPLLYIDLRKASLNDPKHNVVLSDRDVLTILTIQQAKYMPKQEVSIRGAIQSPSDFAMAQGMTVKDLLMRGNNFLPTASTSRIFLQRTNLDGTPGPLLTLDGEKALRGDPKENIFLQEKDVLTIYTKEQAEFVSEKAVTISGAVQKPGKQPLAQGMTVRDLILQSGSILPTASTSRVFLQRTNLDGTPGPLLTLNGEKAMSGDPKENTVLQERDALTIYTKEQTEFIPEKVVTLSGAVQKPGKQTLAQGMTVKDLLLQGGNILPTAYKEVAFLLRTNPDGSFGKLFKINIEKVMEDVPEENIPLQEKDNLKVYTEDQYHFVAEQMVTISGAVQNESTYPRTEGMRLKDLVEQAGGPLPSVFDTIRITHARRMLGSEITKVSMAGVLKDNPKDNILLEDGDHITVLGRKDFLEKPIIVTVYGAVKRPGPISLTRLNARVSEIIKENGGFMENAFLQGAQYYRQPNQIQDTLQQQKLTLVQQTLRAVQDLEYQRVLAVSDIQKVREISKAQNSTNDTSGGLSVLGGGGSSSSQTQKPGNVQWDKVWEHPSVTQARPLQENELRPAGNIAFSLERAMRSPHSADDMIVKDGDKIYIPEKPSTVAVIGAVAVPQYTLFQQGRTLGYYTKVVGGFAPDAAPDYILVISVTGKVLRGNKNTRIELGDMIFVPTKVMAQKLSDKQNDLENTTKSITNGLLSLALIRTIIK